MYRFAGSLKSSTDPAASRTRSAWNDRFVHWERPASTSEEAKIERAARMVRDALAGCDLLGLPLVEVNGQESYFNNTNTRIESDMDIRVDWRHTIDLAPDKGIPYQQARANLNLESVDGTVAGPLVRTKSQWGRSPSNSSLCLEVGRQ